MMSLICRNELAATHLLAYEREVKTGSHVDIARKSHVSCREVGRAESDAFSKRGEMQGGK